MNRFLFGLLVITLSCHQSTVVKDAGKVHLSGQIFAGSSAGQSIKLFDALGREMASDICENGTFNLNIPIISAGYYTLNVDERPIEIYLAKNYDLSFKIKEGSSDIMISGRGSENNRYIRQFEQFEEVNKPAYDQLLAQKEEDFLIEARRYRSKCEAFLNNFQAKNVNLDPKFIAKERARILYAWANRLTHYPEAHIFYTGEDEFVVSADYHDYKKTVNLNAVDLLTLSEYQDFVTSYIDNEAEILKKKGDKREIDQIRFDLVNQNIIEVAVRDFAMYSILRKALHKGLDPVTADLLSIFYKQCQNSIMLAEIRGEEHGWLRLASGKPAPTFEVITSTGEQVELDQFEGRYLYINFWASWCTPCLPEYDALAHLSDGLDTNSISLLAISVDSDKETWLSLCKKKSHSPVIDAFLTQDLNDRVNDIYNVRSLPRYVLIDPSGKIIDANAPAPTDPSLMSLLANFDVASVGLDTQDIIY